MEAFTLLGTAPRLSVPCRQAWPGLRVHRRFSSVPRAFSSRPSVLFADEPTGNLDAETGEHILSLLLDLRARAGTTLVAVTHDPRVAERFDRVVRLAAGRVVEDSAA